jgi:hypothetical protein
MGKDCVLIALVRGFTKDALARSLQRCMTVTDQREGNLIAYHEVRQHDHTTCETGCES